ncbi:rab9 effector protein with kelch motif-like [Dorcoceras hygrometricum]|uniref:Rab9 effector protein with kelch motif-like n=1 Tax=Dorcoceras hygrometricum TaxID=472368 RepID=A0A2Z7C0X9_9LAMI|nr:rab9 effector protein with kelch motif-like [Dorcoceras hygrometricum]
MVLSGSPVTYAEAVDRAVDIEESLLEEQAPVQPSVGRSFQPVQDVSQSFQTPQGLQQSNRQRFKPRGKQFKAHSSSSGSLSSGGSSSGGAFCGQCGGKHETVSWSSRVISHRLISSRSVVQGERLAYRLIVLIGLDNSAEAFFRIQQKHSLDESAKAFFREISRSIISADEESSAGALSIDDISSDVINQQGATVEPVDG